MNEKDLVYRGLLFDQVNNSKLKKVINLFSSFIESREKNIITKLNWKMLFKQNMIERRNAENTFHWSLQSHIPNNIFRLIGKLGR